MAQEVEVFVFSSENITNIWAGYGSSTWAVSRGDTSSAKLTKSERLVPGSLGILYCIPWKAFTVPFVTTTAPDKNAVERDIWNGEWILPFRFAPLGNPRSKIAGADLYRTLSGMKLKNINNYSNYLHVQSNFDFQPSKIDSQDWATLVGSLTPHA
ncbi:MAG: hypothetical protein ACTHJQ_20930 [Rhizobiaceae bacterium]